MIPSGKKGKVLPLDESESSRNDDEDIPEPDDKIDFINDDIKSKNTKCIESILPPPRSILIVCTAGNLETRYWIIECLVHKWWP